MIIWHEKFEHPKEVVKGLIEKYSSEYFLKGDPNWGQHYTGYHRNPHNSAHTVNGGFVDQELLDLYVPKLKSVMNLFGLLDNKSIYSFTSIWGQLYKKELGCIIDVHNHYKEPRQLLSWVHFVKVTEQKCFYFYIDDKKIYPETQSSSDIIFYPSYAMHGVDKMTEGDERFVVVGNISKIK
tara:strand:- start:9 stop:551 length:543 start_codon:yes stop_codon:yes gene_type:complete